MTFSPLFNPIVWQILWQIILQILVPSAIHATVFADRSFPEATQDAPIIVRGTTGQQSVDWRNLSDGTRRLFTLTQLSVSEIFRGDLSDKSILVRELGGEKDGVGMSIAGTAKFAPGEDVILFLDKKNDDGSHSLRAMMMSKFSIVRPDGGKEVLSGPGLGNHKHEQSSEGQDGESTHWTIEDFRNLVQAQDLRNGRDSAGNENTSVPQGKSALQTQENSPGVPPSKSEVAGTSQSPRLNTPVSERFSWNLVLSVLGTLILGIVFFIFTLRNK